MEYRVLYLSERKAWNEAIDRLDQAQRDVYFRPEYYALYDDGPDRQALCFVFEDRGEIAVYPFLKGRINVLAYVQLDDDYYDLEGAYGYNGVAFSSHSADFAARFYGAFDEFCRREKIVAEFTRFNPVLENQAFSAGHLFVERVKGNVVVDLSRSEEEIWSQGYEHSVRKNVNKALRHDLEVSAHEDASRLDEFLAIYRQTMERNKADDFYLFDSDYFADLAHNLSGRMAFFFAEQDRQTLSAELVLYSEKAAYSFLGGTFEQGLPLRANDLLKHHIILEMKRRGLAYFCLGGGFEPEDGVFRYKRKFAKDGVRDFFVGRRVLLPEIYEAVMDQWRRSHPAQARSHGGRLLAYRCLDEPRLEQE